jgi:DNA mismatch repair protein MutS2
VLDELGAGTDPQEGAALARALLTHLLDRGITTLVTTHHPELKSFANATAGVVNASVEFDLETLQPTYHLTIGLPGRSNALAIAQRLGLPDAIISDARKEIKPEDLRVDDLLDEIHKQRNQAHAARTEAEFARKEAEEIRSELNLRLINIEDERQELIENARRESEEMLDELRKEVEAVRKQLSYARQPIEIIESLEQEVEEIQEGIAEPIDQEIKPIRPPETRSIHLGDRVRLRRLGTQGNVIALTEDEAEVQVGMMRVRTRLSDLELAGREPVESDSAPIRSPSEDSPPHPSTGISDGRPPSPGIEIDLRGQRAEDAQDALERYLERAYLSGLPYVRIIHGKGTGRLRNVVRESLNGHPYVKNYEGGGDNEGGEGVTIAKLKSND